LNFVSFWLHSDAERLLGAKWGAAGKIEMNIDQKLKSQLKDRGFTEPSRRQRQEEALDDALKDTFPASDPISIEQPVPPAADRD